MEETKDGDEVGSGVRLPSTNVGDNVGLLEGCIDDVGELELVGADEGGETGGAVSVGTTSVTGVGSAIGTVGLGEEGKTAGIDDGGELGLVGADEGGKTGGGIAVGT